MSKYIDAEKLIKSVNNYREGARAALNPIDGDADYYTGKIDACEDIKEFITSLQQEQPEVGLEKVYDAYCKVCGHYPHTTPAYICRHACDYFKDFEALLNARGRREANE